MRDLVWLARIWGPLGSLAGEVAATVKGSEAGEGYQSHSDYKKKNANKKLQLGNRGLNRERLGQVPVELQSLKGSGLSFIQTLVSR